MRKVVSSVSVLAFVVLLQASAEAALLTVSFTGQFSSQTGLSPHTFAGSSISGSFTFDTTTADSNGDADKAVYVDTLTVLSGSVTGGSSPFNFSATDGNITIRDNTVTGSNFEDFYEVRAGGGDGVSDSDVSSYALVAFNFSMRTVTNPAGSGITSTNLGVVPALFDTPTIVLTFQPDSGCGGTSCPQHKLEYRVTELSQVPEPGSLSLMGLGFAALYRRIRRR
jgi:hypothetical protein